MKKAKRPSNEEAVESLKREDWDFYSVPADELYACQWWEYARESARIRAFYQPEDSDFFPSPGIEPEVRRLDGTVMIEARRRLLDPIRMQFVRLLWEYALPVKRTMERAHESGIKSDALDCPWQFLPAEVRRGVVEDLAPYFAKMPGLTFLPFNRCSDLRDLGIAGEDYRCARFDRKTGIEWLRAEIDWAEFSDWQIVEAFRRWVKENRPRGVGRADDRGRHKGAGLYAQLKCVGILRLMNAIPFTSIRTRHPDTWKRYRSMDWPRARQNADRTFRRLFFFLPETDRPFHWPTAGRRAK